MPVAEYEIEIDLGAEQAWEKLRDFSAAMGIGVWETLENLDAPATLEDLFDMYGPNLKIVDVGAAQVDANLVARAAEFGVRLCLVGAVEDTALSGGDNAPWRASLKNSVAAFSTEYPDSIVGLLGR